MCLNSVTRYCDFNFEKKKLFESNNKFKKPIIENNSCIIHVYGRSYSSEVRSKYYFIYTNNNIIFRLMLMIVIVY